MELHFDEFAGTVNCPHQDRDNVTERRQLLAGLGLVVLGIIVAVVASVGVHMAEADEFNEFGQELYAGFPRGWLPATVAQAIALGGVLMSMAGIALAFLYGKALTWSRAMLGALLFTALMFIIFAIIPNQMLTLFQGPLGWGGDTFFTIPAFLVLGNEISISYSVIKDMIVAGYATTMLIALPVVMYQWQERAKKKESAPPPEPISTYGRPLRAPNGHGTNGHGNGQVIG